MSAIESSINKRCEYFISAYTNVYMIDLGVTSRSHKGFKALEELAHGERVDRTRLVKELGVTPESLRELSHESRIAIIMSRDSF